MGRTVPLNLCKMCPNNNAINICIQKYISICDPSCILGTLHIVTLMLRGKHIRTGSFCLEQWHSMSVCLSVSQSVSHSLTLCLSVCFNTICHYRLSVWPSICSIRQSIPLVFDSWCVILSVHLSDIIQMQCARAECPGDTISSPPPPPPPPPLNVCHRTPSSLAFLGMHACLKTCNMSLTTGMHLTEHGVRMQMFSAAL